MSTEPNVDRPVKYPCLPDIGDILWSCDTQGSQTGEWFVIPYLVTAVIERGISARRSIFVVRTSGRDNFRGSIGDEIEMSATEWLRGTNRRFARTKQDAIDDALIAQRRKAAEARRNTQYLTELKLALVEKSRVLYRAQPAPEDAPHCTGEGDAEVPNG